MCVFVCVCVCVSPLDLGNNHVDVEYAHYGLDFYPGDANHTAGLFAKFLHDLEQPPVHSSRIFIYGCGTPLLN